MVAVDHILNSGTLPTAVAFHLLSRLSIGEGRIKVITRGLPALFNGQVIYLLAFKLRLYLFC